MAGSPKKIAEAFDESARLEALKKFQIAGTAPEGRFDSLARFAAGLFESSMAYVSFVEKDRQWFKAHIGDAASETPREISFCKHTIMSDDAFVVLDATQDARFASSPLVTGEPSVRFYAGAPLVTADGHRVGALCVVDRRPRERFSAWERSRLKELAAMVVEQMELRRGELARAAMAGFRRDGEKKAGE